MPTIEEMSLWSVEEVHAQILASLPGDWVLTPSQNPTSRMFSCSVTDEAGTVHWAEEHPDLRLLLFDLYGWLVLRETKSVSSMWIRPREALPKGVREVAATPGGTSDGDPEDLDPEQVRLVYEKAGIRV